MLALMKYNWSSQLAYGRLLGQGFGILTQSCEMDKALDGGAVL
jgi:hypothetical protein